MKSLIKYSGPTKLIDVLPVEVNQLTTDYAETHRLHVATFVASSIVDYLVHQKRLDENQGNFVFDKLTDAFMELNERELYTYMETGIGGLYE